MYFCRPKQNEGFKIEILKSELQEKDFKISWNKFASNKLVCTFVAPKKTGNENWNVESESQKKDFKISWNKFASNKIVCTFVAPNKTK